MIKSFVANAILAVRGGGASGGDGGAGRGEVR